jgi:ABC-type oligopeptide transport system ATPase subunit
MSPLVSIESLTYSYEVRRGLRHSIIVAAVSGVSLTIQQGTFISIVGESGSGKSTLGRTVVGLLRPSSGRVVFEGQDVAHLSRSQLTAFRRSVQIVFQNPYQSLNPRMTVGAALREVLRVTAPKTDRDRGVDARVSELLEMVHLPATYREKYPHQLSGGQRQRVAIARAMAVRPKLLIADEPVSALDVSASAHVLNLLQELQAQGGLTCMFITHDIGLARLVSDTIVVMHSGKIVETGTPSEIFDNPQDKYTKLLVGADLGSHAVDADEIANQVAAQDT